MNAEQKMKKYTKSVERRLNLPREIKDRVMSDFVSSITARQEAGKPDEEIYAELNEQMKAFSYRKSPWRFLFGALAAYGAAELLGSLIAWLLHLYFNRHLLSVEMGEAAVGIIGGADGPTAIFVTNPGWTSYVFSVLLLGLGIWGYLRLRRCKQN